MDIQVKRTDSYSVLHCQGQLDMQAAPRLRDAIADAVTPESPRIVIDLSATPAVDSSGLGALVGGLKRARQYGGDLRISGARDQVLTVLRLTNLDQVLRPFSTVLDATDDW